MRSSANRMVAALFTFGALFAACSSDKSTTDSSKLSARGESCRASSDCAAGLVCVGGRCSVGSYNLQPTGKQCVLVQCHEPKDCCPTPPTSCPTLLQACEGGFTFDCQLYQMQCVCDGSKFSCDSGKCTQSCTPSDGITTDTCKVL